MSKKSSVPSYRRHRQSGQAVVTLSDGMGSRHDVLLGKYGTKESRLEYARVIKEWEAAGRRWIKPGAVMDTSVNEIILAYWRHLEANYRGPDGTPSRHLDNVRDALRPLKALYGHTTAREFGPLALKAIMAHMVQDGLCRNTINRRLGHIKSLFRWAESEELLPPSILHALETVKGLQRGRTAARETASVRPVELETVEATLPFLRPTVGDMVRLQHLTGMRSGELVILRGIDLDMTGKVWKYRPGSDRGPYGTHKTAHHGHARTVPLGPRAQEIVRKFLRSELYAYLFSPREVVSELRVEQRRKRKTRVQPSQRDRRKRRAKRRPGDRYTVGTYRQAIERAILAANRARACAACKDLNLDARCPACREAALPHWHPHQLRHAKATEIRREAGLDAARVVLGHRSPRVTEVYAELDEAKAAEVMARLG
jgi:integrase